MFKIGDRVWIKHEGKGILTRRCGVDDPHWWWVRFINGSDTEYPAHEEELTLLVITLENK